MTVITVSGMLASGAREVAQAVARELRLDYVDQEILVEAARQLGVSVSAVERHDERAASLGERLSTMMRTLMERSASAGSPDPGAGGLEMVLARTYGEAAELPSDAPRGQLDDASYLRTLTSVIKGVAARGDVVILGRGSQVILQHHPATLHAYISAPRELRAAALAQRDGITPEEAERRIRRSDQQRHEFHRRYFKVDPADPLLYDLTLHAGRLSQPLMVELIARTARDRAPRPG